MALITGTYSHLAKQSEKGIQFFGQKKKDSVFCSRYIPTIRLIKQRNTLLAGGGISNKNSLFQAEQLSLESPFLK